MTTVTFLLVLAAATAEPAPFKGTLCLSNAKACIATEKATVEIAAAETPRTWVWTSADASRVVVGDLEPNGGAIELASERLRRVPLSLSGSARRGWPADVRITILEGKQAKWEWTVPTASVRKLREVAIPNGKFFFALKAARHLPEGRALRPEGDVPLGSIELKPLPAVRARVVRVEEDKRIALAGAQVFRSDGELLATTGHDGSFEVELNAPVPEEILIVHPGLATQVVALTSDARRQALTAETNLGDVVLESGRRLALRIVRSGDAAGMSVRVRLFKEVRDKYELVPIKQGDLPADEEALSFSDLPAGEFFITAEGEHSLQYYQDSIELKDDVSRTIEIKPYRLTGTVRFGEEVLREGDVTISSGRLRRERKLAIDEEGRFGGLLWQGGKLRGFIHSKTLGTIVGVDSPELGEDPSEWDITLRRRLIEGRVLDGETKQPLAGTAMRLEKQAGSALSRTRLYTSVAIDPDGRYAIAAMDDGTYDIKISHPERLPVQKTIELSDRDPSRRIDFLLERGAETKVEVVWPSGAPVANAPVIEGVARDGHNPGRMFATDAAGRLTVHSNRDESRTLFVLPKEGSFAIVRVAPGSPETVRVVAPPPAGGIRLTLLNSDGKPDYGRLMMRFNGEWIPYSVIGRLPIDFSTRGVVGLRDLPGGTYEFWAVKPTRDAENTFVPPGATPVRVGLSGGEQVVEVPIG